MIGDCILLGFLSAFSWIDIKKKEFPLALLGICAATGLCLFLVTKDKSLFGLLGGMCVGGGLLLASLANRESIGLGDGLLLIITGIYLGLWRNLALLFLAVIFCAGIGLVLVLAKKYTCRQSLPFAPFLLAADVALLALSV